MNKGKYVFRQMCEFLPRDSFEWYVKKYKGNARIRTFSCYQHLLVMVLGQLWQCRSLGVLVNVLNSLGSALYQMGIGKRVSKSTISDANSNRDCRIFEEMANLMIKIARGKRQGKCSDKFLDDKDVYAFDSSTISLSLGLFKWSKLHHDKGGIKMHTLYEVKTDIPSMVYISDASLHDSKAMPMITYESGAYYVFDRAYMALFNLFAIHQVGAYFVVREKRNMRFNVVEDKYYNNPDSGILADQLIEFTGYLTHKRYPEVLRRIVFYDVEGSRRFVFYTNNLSVTAEAIALLYKYRWRVELFFYEKYIVMRSERESSPENQVDTDLLLRSTSHNDNHFLSPLSQSRRFLLDSQDLSGSRLGVRSVYAFSKASRFAFESARAYMSVVCIETCPRMSRI